MGKPSHIRNKNEYRSLLHKLIRKLRISFPNKNVRKKLKVLVVFLSTQKLEGNWASSPAISQNHSIIIMGKSFSQINKYANFALIIHSF